MFLRKRTGRLAYRSTWSLFPVFGGIGGAHLLVSVYALFLVILCSFLYITIFPLLVPGFHSSDFRIGTCPTSIITHTMVIPYLGVPRFESYFFQIKSNISLYTAQQSLTGACSHYQICSPTIIITYTSGAASNCMLHL